MGKKGDFSWAQIVAPSGVRKMNDHFCATGVSSHPCRAGSVSGHDNHLKRFYVDNVPYAKNNFLVTVICQQQVIGLQH